MTDDEKEEVPTEEKPLEHTNAKRIAELEQLLKRLQADFDNFRKRTDKERDELVQIVNASFIIKLLPILDELEHTLKEAQKHGAKEAIGLEAIYKNFMALLASEGVKEMKCEKEKFDPYLHEAIKQEFSDVSEGHISMVLKKGYYLKDTILRHALVIVSKGAKAKGEIND